MAKLRGFGEWAVLMWGGDLHGLKWRFRIVAVPALGRVGHDLGHIALNFELWTNSLPLPTKGRISHLVAI